MRIVGWLLIGMGAVLALLTALALTGLIPLQIDFFGFNLDTRRERIALLAGLLIATVIGFVLLRISHRRPNNITDRAA